MTTTYTTSRFRCPAVPEVGDSTFCSTQIKYTEAWAGGTVDLDAFTRRAHIYAQARHGWVPRAQLHESGVEVWVDAEQTDWLICPDCAMSASGVNASVLDARCPDCGAAVGEKCSSRFTHQTRLDRQKRIRERRGATT